MGPARQISWRKQCFAVSCKQPILGSELQISVITLLKIQGLFYDTSKNGVWTDTWYLIIWIFLWWGRDTLSKSLALLTCHAKSKDSFLPLRVRYILQITWIDCATPFIESDPLARQGEGIVTRVNRWVTGWPNALPYTAQLVPLQAKSVLLQEQIINRSYNSYIDSSHLLSSIDN